MNLFRLLLSFALTLCAGCFRPDYRVQYVDLPEAWRFPANTETTLCNFRWWEQLEDPVLNQLILTALQNNQDIQIAISRVFEYYALLGITNADLYPQLTGEVFGERRKQSSALKGGENLPSKYQSRYILALHASWELDLWGRFYSASEAACARLREQIEVRRGVIISIVSSVATQYVLLRQLDEQLEVSKRTLLSRLESLKLANNRYELGETSLIEVAQAESEVEIARIRVTELERFIPQTENALSVLMGENPHAIPRGKPLEGLRHPLVIPAGIPSDLLIRRPDILAAEDELIATNAEVTQARALFFPQITLTGTYGTESDQLRRLFTSPAEIWSYGLDAIQILFDAGKTCYLVKAAKERRNQALFNYRNVILNAFREVNDALIAYRKNNELVREHRHQVAVLKEYLKLAKLQYTEGEIDYLNVLDAERSLFNAQLEEVRSEAESFAALISLYAALGGGWVVDADTISLN